VACAVVCISHATGAGGEEVGRLVAERLGFLYVDDEIVARAAAAGGIDPGEIADAERRKSFVGRVLDALAQGGGDAWAYGMVGMPPGGPEVYSEDLRALIREAIEQTAARGNVVIVAHAASQVVPAGPQALRVLVTASAATRAERLGDDGAQRVTKEDAARRDYLKRFYGVDEESPTHYDLVINTDVLSVDQAADVVSQVSSR
jgi:cytidylate kinase